MKHRSTLSDAIKLLRLRGWKVEERGNRYLAYLGTDSLTYTHNHYYTVRELIRTAKYYSKNDNQRTKIKSNLKKESKRERSFVRDEIRKFGEDSDTNHPRKKFSDLWNWD